VSGVQKDDGVILARLKVDLLARIGAALLSVQTTERALHLVTTFVIQKPGTITAEQLIAQSNAAQKKTLGYFLAELRKRVDLDVHFDGTLCEFLRRRNLLAHNLSDLPGWNTDTVHGIYIGRCFINELLEMNGEVLKVFAALLRAWQAQRGDKTFDVPGHPFFEEVDTRYVPLVDSLLFAKEPKQP
jgi:hypothetical protein